MFKVVTEKLLVGNVPHRRIVDVEGPDFGPKSDILHPTYCGAENWACFVPRQDGDDGSFTEPCILIQLASLEPGSETWKASRYIHRGVRMTEGEWQELHRLLFKSVQAMRIALQPRLPWWGAEVFIC